MWGERESLTANDNDLISVSLKIIRAPSSGRGRRAKRDGVGFPECGSTFHAANLRPEGAEIGFCSGLKRNGREAFPRFVIPSAAEGSFSFAVCCFPS